MLVSCGVALVARCSAAGMRSPCYHHSPMLPAPQMPSLLRAPWQRRESSRLKPPPTSPHLHPPSPMSSISPLMSPRQ